MRISDWSSDVCSSDLGDIEGECVRFVGAQRRAHEQLREVREKIPAGTPSDIAAFIDTHILMLDDRSITDATIGYIRSQHINAEAALRKTRDALIAVFEQMDDRSEEHTSELQSLMRISYAVFCLKKKQHT